MDDMEVIKEFRCVGPMRTTKIVNGEVMTAHSYGVATLCYYGGCSYVVVTLQGSLDVGSFMDRESAWQCFCEQVESLSDWRFGCD